MPVVGFDVPGVRDVLREGQCGVLVPPAEGVAGLAWAVRLLLQDAAHREQVVAAGQSGLDAFAPARVAAALRARYEAGSAGRSAGS